MSNFLTSLVVRLVHDTAYAGQGRWELVEPLHYVAADGRAFVVPAGFVTDFASTPRAPLAYWVAGCTAHRAAVLHDYLCRTGIIPRREADDIFYEAMLATGVPKWRARLMHLAVRSYTETL